MIFLITGANNYIAHDLINFFSENKSNKIIGSYKKKIKKIKKKNIFYKKIDLKKKININFKFDALIHCAAATPLKSYNKKDYSRINVTGLQNLLKFCKQKAKYIILLSTISVYGEINSKIISERTPLKGMNEYAKSKIKMENDLKKFSKKNNTKILILRLPGVIGKTINSNNFLSETISKIKSNKEFNIYNPNHFFNNLITTKVLYRIIQKFINKSKNKIEIYNCASTKPEKLISLILYLAKILKTTPKFKLINSQSNSFNISTKKILQNNYPLMSTKLSLKEIFSDI